MMKISTLTELPLSLAQAAPSAPGGGGMATQLIFFGLMFAAMYFLLIAPQRKKQKEHEKMLAAIETGDEIITSGGIYGTVSNVRQDRLVVKISENTKIELAKGSISTVVRKAGAVE